MKTYIAPEVEKVIFATESITDVSMGGTSGSGNDDI